MIILCSTRRTDSVKFCISAKQDLPTGKIKPSLFLLMFKNEAKTYAHKKSMQSRQAFFRGSLFVFFRFQIKSILLKHYFVMAALSLSRSEQQNEAL